MATGPDPNRFQTTDPELQTEDIARGNTVGDYGTARLGLSGWGIVIVAAIVAAFVVGIFLF